MSWQCQHLSGWKKAVECRFSTNFLWNLLSTIWQSDNLTALSPLMDCNHLINNSPSAAHNCNRSKRFGKFWLKSAQSKSFWKSASGDKKHLTSHFFPNNWPKERQLGRQFQSRTCVQSSNMTNTTLKGAYQSLRHAVEQTMARNLFMENTWTKIVLGEWSSCARGVLITG